MATIIIIIHSLTLVEALVAEVLLLLLSYNLYYYTDFKALDQTEDYRV